MGFPQLPVPSLRFLQPLFLSLGLLHLPIDQLVDVFSMD